MKSDHFLKSNKFKIILPIIIITSIIIIFKGGYEFGKWLYLAIN